MVVAVVGPTGSGKTDLALFLAQSFGGEIVNCDSVQVYQGLDVGSAKTPPWDRRGIPHHLLDVISVRQELTAGEYARQARPVVRDILHRGRLPIVAGGTGFYLRALFEGLSPAPARDATLRFRLGRHEQRTPGLLHRYLTRFDPAAAARIHPHDIQKLIRAVEITRLAHQPATQTQAQPRDAFNEVDVVYLGLSPDRAQLAARITARTEYMFEHGILDETRRALGQLTTIPKALGAVGYKQAVAHLQGQLTLAEAKADTSLRTRQYAKRQLTWFRANPAIRWLSGFGSQPAIQQEAASYLARALSPAE